jgi:hypothetical protein
LLLSSSLLIDRIFLHTALLDTLGKAASAQVWAISAANPRLRPIWSSSSAGVERFPEVLPFKAFPYVYFRRLNEFVWDFRQQSPSRISIRRNVRDKVQRLHIRALKLPAHLLAIAKAEHILEDNVEKLLLSYQRSPEAEDRLKQNPPDLLFVTGPFQFEQPAIVATAKKLGIPTLALIPSWDNISTKNRMVYKYDAYIVWSQQMKRELLEFYPHAREVPVYVVGAPQFDVFFQRHFYLSRGEFCAAQGLKPELPIIVYALGSPNFIREQYGALDMADRVWRGDLGNVQMLVRPHPIHDNREMAEAFKKYLPRVVLQQTAQPGEDLTSRSQDESQIVEWVNTLRHADVVVNLSSTVTIDAALFDRPVVNLDYDPEPHQPNQALVKDVNHRWLHFKPVAESGGVWLVNDPEAAVEAIQRYLVQPELHRAKRRWIAEYVCEHLDGRGGERLAQAILDFAGICKRRKDRIWQQR